MDGSSASLSGGTASNTPVVKHQLMPSLYAERRPDEASTGLDGAGNDAIGSGGTTRVLPWRSRASERIN